VLAATLERPWQHQGRTDHPLDVISEADGKHESGGGCLEGSCPTVPRSISIDWQKKGRFASVAVAAVERF
jgi:hypothetical protein